MTRPLTPARRHALLVLAVGRRSGRLVRSSTATSRLGELLDHDDRRPLRIYHQTAEWLATQGWVDRNDIGTLTC